MACLCRLQIKYSNGPDSQVLFTASLTFACHSLFPPGCHCICGSKGMVGLIPSYLAQCLRCQLTRILCSWGVELWSFDTCLQHSYPCNLQVNVQILTTLLSVGTGADHLLHIWVACVSQTRGDLNNSSHWVSGFVTRPMVPSGKRILHPSCRGYQVGLCWRRPSRRQRPEKVQEININQD